MIHKTEAGTDVATIGIWDSGAVDDISDKSISEYLKIIDEKSKRGELLYVNTGADGSFDSWACFDEIPDLDLKNEYKKIPGPFYLRARSGKMFLDGLDGYGFPPPAITGEDDKIERPSGPNLFELPAGYYSVEVYQLILGEEEAAEQIEKEVGAEAFRHYSKTSHGCGMALGLLMVGIVCAVVWGWYYLVPAILAGYAITKYKSIKNSKDEVLAEVGKVVEEWDARHPFFVFMLEQVESIGESRGNFELE